MKSIQFSHTFHRVWPVAVLLVLILYFFQESVENLQYTWRSFEGYDHGLLVVCVWLAGLVMIESHGDDDDVKSPRNAFLIVPLLVLTLASFFNAVGAAFEVEVIQYATTFAFAVVAAFLITRPVSLLKFIVLTIFLASGMPLWDLVLGVLQALTIYVTDMILRLFEVPVLFTGDVVELPYGRLRIAEGCGGLRYFLSALAFSTFYVFLFIGDSMRGTVFIFVACLLALVANWVRVAGIVWIGYVSEMQSEMVQDHYLYGWLVFAVFLIPTYWIGHKLQHERTHV